MFNENVLSEINELIKNIPSNLTTLEKLRLIYINLGYIFCYDYRKALNDYKDNKNFIDFFSNVGRFQTCLEITDILNYVLNKIEGLKARTIVRKNPSLRGMFNHDHVANEVILEDENLKLLLDLTLDLYLIQAGCMTKHFGYEDDGSGTYDIISQAENKKMDEKLGFTHEYTDYQIEKLKEIMKSQEFLSSPNLIEDSILLISRLNRHFRGYHESKQYINLLLSKLASFDYKEFNLFYINGQDIELRTVYNFESGNDEKWYFYQNGFIETTTAELETMLSNGWITNSTTLAGILKFSKKV